MAYGDLARRPPDWRDQSVDVEVRNRFDGSWSNGFDVVEIVEDPTGLRFRLRRHSDGTILPELFSADEVTVYRPEA